MRHSDIKHVFRQRTGFYLERGSLQFVFNLKVSIRELGNDGQWRTLRDVWVCIKIRGLVKQDKDNISISLDPIQKNVEYGLRLLDGRGKRLLSEEKLIK